MGQPKPTDFLPSLHAFGFANTWPDEPAFSVPTPFGPLGIGNAARGLCGGMVFGALDYWHAGVEPPTGLPSPSEPLYRFIVRRLIQSWHVPTGVARYYYWMNLPDDDTVRRHRWPGLPRDAGLHARTIALQWPRIKAQLDAGQPTPVGLVTVAGANPFKLGRNHQVLGYAYQLAETAVTLRVYDPNTGPSDDVSIGFDLAAARSGFTHSINIGLPVRGLFLTPYSPATPPRTVTSSR